MDERDNAALPRRSRRGLMMYGFASLLVAVGIFMGLVANRMMQRGETFSDAVVQQIVHIPTPREVFHKDRIYLMVLGIDYDYDDKDQPYSAHSRSDTIMAAGLDFPAKSARLISVLRDTDVTVNGRESKINAAYSEGGVKLADAVVGEFLGMPVDARGRHFDRYVVVRVNALKDLIDAIGGIDVLVTQTMNYDDNWGHLHIHFKPGLVHMNGEQAQGYARFRHDECSDPCRTKRQQQVIRIIVDKLKRDRLNDLFHIGQLVAVFRRDVDTNLSTDELKALAWSFKDASTADLVHAGTIGYVATKETLDGETVIADEHERATLVADLLGPYAKPKPLPAGVAAVTPSDVHVVVENGSGVRGAATQVAGMLRSRGYVVDAVGDADSFGYDTTRIEDDAASSARGARLRADLGFTAAILTTPKPSTKGGAVRIVVGRDYARKTP
jgi:polyisoprenyl-teichoic acid--peptidoglycan teichoic acid transferase